MGESDAIVGFFILGIYAAIFILWIWAFIDVLISDFKKDINKVIWILVVIFVPIGFLIYLIFGRGQKEKKLKN